MNPRSKKTAAIILAAGASKRLGQPKQAVIFGRQTLLQKTVATALASNVSEVIVVLGANESLCRSQLSEYQLRIIVNKNWSAGVSSSIKAGLDALDCRVASEFDSAIFLTCDQPFLSKELINEMISAYNLSKANIVACSYSGCIGIPALFSAELFDEMRQLSGDCGARVIIQKYQNSSPEFVHAISFPEGKIDIDTSADLRNILRSSQDSVAQSDIAADS